MKQSMPRWFAALCVAVLLLCSALVTFFLFQQSAASAAIADLQGQLKIKQGQLRKQQMEYDEYLAALPLVQAELAEIQPQADAAYAWEQDLRAQRKTLRAENAALSEELTALQSEAGDAAAIAQQTAEAYRLLDDALLQMQTLIQSLQ